MQTLILNKYSCVFKNLRGCEHKQNPNKIIHKDICWHHAFIRLASHHDLKTFSVMTYQMVYVALPKRMQ